MSFSPSLAVLGLLAPVALLVSGCTRSESSAGELAASTGARPRVAPKVRTAPVERREMVRYLETTTVLESEFDIELFARRAGEVVEVLVEEGDRVDMGDVLARLDDREERLAVRETEVALEEARNASSRATLAVQEARAQSESAKLAAQQAERDFARNQRLYEGRAVASPLSEQALETSRLERDNKVAEHGQAEIAVRRSELEEQNAKTAVSKAEVALERAHVALDQMQLIAPFDAVVAQRNVRLGDSAGAGEFAFKLTDPRKLRAVFNRPQRELSLFQSGAEQRLNGAGPGLGLTAVAEALPDRVFRGEIVRVAPTVDPLSGNFRVTAHIDEPTDEESALLPGMLLRLKIATDRHPDALVVPKRAIRREGETSSLFVVEEDQLRQVTVEERFTDDNDVEVVPDEAGALQEGDRVVVVGNRDLEDGSAVQVDDAVQVGDPAKVGNDPQVDDASSGGTGEDSESE